MHSAASALFLLSIVFTLVHSQESLIDETQKDTDKNTEMVERLRKDLAELNSSLHVYDVAINEILTPKLNEIVFQNKVNDLTKSANEQLKSVYDVKEKLALHEKSINESLARQEEQLSKLEPQLRNLETQWRNQSSELGQLKQLWSDLGNKSVARAADVKSLELSIKGLEDRLSQQEAKMDKKESDTDLESAEELLKSMQEDLEESLNTQSRLESVLETLKNQIAVLQAGGGGKSAPIVSVTQADNLCKRMTST